MTDGAALPAAAARALQALLGDAGLSLDPAERWAYSYDNSRLQRLPGAVARPADEGEVAAVVRLCNEHRIAITARGLGTGTAGAAVPLEGALVLSSERLDQILIDAPNRVARVQAGVTNGALQRAAGAAGFFWPPDPTSANYSTVGGNLACNAAGPRAVKYGTPRENTLGLRAVSGSGVLLRTGCYTTKGVVGYDLTRLLIGSEGTLGVIVEATLKLTPLPEAVRVLRLLYTTVDAAARGVSAIMAQPTVPRAVEFCDDQALRLLRDYAGADLPDEANAMLMVEVDGTTAGIGHSADAIMAAARNEGLVEARAARDEAESAALWQARKALSPALRNIAPRKINEDVVVPVARIPDLVASLAELSRQHGIPIVSFGHAGNGNLHVNLLVDPDDPAQQAASEPCLAQLFARVLELGGTLSGEHGIGEVKREYVALEIEPATLDLMRRIKDQFDPLGILNPGKLFPATVA